MRTHSIELATKSDEDDEIFAEAPEEQTKLLIEKITNEGLFDDEAHLRCILSLRYPETEHFYIFQKQEGDLVYMVQKVTEKMAVVNQDDKTDDARTNFDIFMTEILSQIESKLSERSCLTALFSNTSINDSYAITSA